MGYMGSLKHVFSSRLPTDMIIPHPGVGQQRVLILKQVEAWTLKTTHAHTSSASLTTFGYHRKAASSFSRLWAPAHQSIRTLGNRSNDATNIVPFPFNVGQFQQQRHFHATTHGNMADDAALERLEEGARAPRGGGGKGKRGGRGGGGGAPDREVLISKALSALLRHKASDAGIDLDGEGFARLDQVVGGLFVFLGSPTLRFRNDLLSQSNNE